MLSALLVLGLVNFSVGAGINCCTKTQWEAIEGIIGGDDSIGDEPQFFEASVKLYVDGKAKKIAADSNVFANGTWTKLKAVKDYSKGVEYVIQNGTCKRAKIGSWKKTCVPAQAKFFARSYIGGKANALYINSYGLDLLTTKMTISVAKDCVPVGMTVHGSTHGMSYLSSVGWSNFTVGIKNRAAFRVPTNCASAEFETTLQQVGGGSSLYDLL